MKVSLNWIKDCVDLPLDMDPTRLAYDPDHVHRGGGGGHGPGPAV